MSVNLIIKYSMPLINLLSQIQLAPTKPSLKPLQQHILSEVSQLQSNLSNNDLPTEMITMVHYCLCAAIDEAILNTSWSSECRWADHSLLSQYYNDTRGGERFYLILDNLLKNIRHNLAVIELLYVLLSLGFQGQYYDQHQMQLEQLRNRIFDFIRQAHGKYQRRLCESPCLENSYRYSQTRKKMIKRMSQISAAVVISFLILANLTASQQSAAIVDRINKAARSSPAAVYNQLVTRSAILGSE